MERIQFARRGRSAVRSPSPRLRHLDGDGNDQVRHEGDPDHPGSFARCSKKSAMRARAASWARVVGEGCFSGLGYFPAPYGCVSHTLRAANSNRRYAQSDACDAL